MNIVDSYLDYLNEMDPGTALAHFGAGAAIGTVAARALTRWQCKKYFKTNPEKYKRCMSLRSSPVGITLGAAKEAIKKKSLKAGARSVGKDLDQIKKDYAWGRKQLQKKKTRGQ
jgi:hypothetical protein